MIAGSRPAWVHHLIALTAFAAAALVAALPGAAPAEATFPGKNGMNANGHGRTNITNTPTFNERASDWGPRVRGYDGD